MSITAVFSNTTLTQTWATSNKSDSYTSAEADGGSITRELGPVGTQSQQTVVYTCPAAIEKIHMGTWVTPAAPQNISVLANTNMVIGALSGYESAGTLNAYVAVKVSVVTESSNVLSFNRTLVDWTLIKVENTDLELGTVVGASAPMGGYSANGLASQLSITSADTIATGERIAIEVAIDKQANKTGTVAIEFGSDPDTIDDDTLTAGTIGTGPFSCAVLMPFAMNEANQSVWGDHHHSEIEIPRVAGTNAIAWADIGSDWTAAKWETNPAAHYVSRSAGAITAQFWIFQDDDYLYVATNNIIDGCIQPSDHHSIYICSDGNYENSLTTTTGDYLFRRDIVASTSFDGSDPTLPVAVGDGNDQGNCIFKGGSSNTYPNSWEIPTWTTATDTFSFSENGAEDWVEGVDYRMGGPGATTTAPNGSAGAYSEFKIKKSRLNNWNGSDHIGIMVNLNCDVQGNGHTLWPRLLGNQVDKDDWNFSGVNYLATDGNTASSKSTASPMDLRPLMSIHGHGPALANQASGTPSIPNITSTGSAKLGRKASGSPTIANVTTTGSAKLGLTASGSPTIANITSTGVATRSGTVHNASGTPSIENITSTGNAQIQKWEYIGGNYSHAVAHPISHTHGLTILEGDLVYAHVHLNSAQTGITPDQAGWTELYDGDPTGAAETTRIGVYWKVASASEPATYSWTGSSSSYWLVGIKVFRAREAGVTPILERTTVAVYDGSDSQMPVTADAGATVNPNSLRIIAGMKDTRGGVLEYNIVDSGYVDPFGNSDNQVTALAHKEFAAGGTLETAVTIGPSSISDAVYSTSTVFNYTTPSKTASGSPTIENITSTGAAKLGRKASGSPTIANVTTTGSATKVRTASGSPTIATVTSTGSATAKKIASGSPFIETLTTTGTATTRKVASGSPSIGNLTTTGTATAKKIASGSPFIETLTSTGSAAAYKVASGSPTIENLTSTGVATRSGTVDKTASGSPTLPNITAVGNSFIWPKVWLNASQTLSGATEMQVTSVSSDGTSITFTDPVGGPTGAELWLGVENRANSDIGWIQVTVTDGAPLVVFGGFGA